MCLYDSNLICLNIKTLDSSLNILGVTNFQNCARSISKMICIIRTTNALSMLLLYRKASDRLAFAYSYDFASCKDSIGY